MSGVRIWCRLPEGRGCPPLQTTPRNLELMNVTPSPNYSLRAMVRPLAKRSFDIVGAGFLLVVIAPVFLLVMAMVRIDGGPAFFSHTRVGRNGVTFGCLKFRTMVPDAAVRLDALLKQDQAARREWESTRKLRNDPRITRLGRILRATSLDELPQLINVLRGQMSIVGPRPVVQQELAQFYGDAASIYSSVRPGITGPWQVSGRCDTGYQERVRLDAEYATNPSLRRDMVILMRTPAAVLRGRGAY